MVKSEVKNQIPTVYHHEDFQTVWIYLDIS